MRFNMQKVKNILEKIKNWSLRKKIIYAIIIVVVLFVGYMILKPKDNSANITTDIAKIINLKQTVLATGQVTSNTDLNLSFFASGIVRSVKVKVGDEVKEGQILATLDQGNELASLTSARGQVAAAQAKFQRILDGSSNEEVKLAQVALENAKHDYDRLKLQQEILVNNAYNVFLNSTLEVTSYPVSKDYTAPTVSGTYNLGKEGQIIIEVGLNTNSFQTHGLIKEEGNLSRTTPQAIGNSGLFIQFPDNVTLNFTDWVIEIPNKKALNYLANYNAYQAALKTKDSVLGIAQASIDQREAELALKQSTARPADIDLAKAEILSAEGQYQLASANFEHTILRAPANGTITKVDIKIGELAQALKDVMILQDIGNIYLEANVNEANIASIKTGSSVDITFDAFNTEQIFKGYILKIDPSSTLVSGVVNYKITASVLNAPELRPGMTANMTILVEEKNGILAVPSRAIIKDKSGTKIVRVVNNPKTKTYKDVAVTTGMEGDGGFTEVTSGLTEGNEIVVLIKQ